MTGSARPAVVVGNAGAGIAFVARCCIVGAAVLFTWSLALGADEPPYEPGSVRREIEAAVRENAPERALAALDHILDDATPRIRPRHVEAAKAAMDLLPHDVASERAARLIAEALRIDPSDKGGAWSAAQDLRRDLLRRTDVETGARFLEKLIEIYPAVPQYRHELAVLLLDGSRRTEARAQLTRNLEMAPSDAWAGYTLAFLREEDGDVAGAIAVYDAMLDAAPGELRAHLLKARLLSAPDRPAARRALDAGVRAAEESPSESLRADYLETFAVERTRLDAADRRRDAIAAIRRRTAWTTGLALAAWAVVAAVACRATRLPPGK